jgi:imidazolonepropionase-like amidohydrolase
VEELKAMVEEAHRLDRRVVGHVLGTEGIRNAVEAGLDALEHCRWEREGDIGSGGDYDRSWAERIADEGIYVDNNLSARMGSINSSPQPEEELERAHSELAYLRDMKEMGVKMVLCTDAGTSLVPFDRLPLAAEGGMKLLEMSAMEAIVACTSLPAQEMGLEGEIGSVEPGKNADLLLVEGNPLEDIRGLTRVDRVFRDGVEVVAGDKLYLSAE